jgi:hypothetical protein
MAAREMDMADLMTSHHDLVVTGGVDLPLGCFPTYGRSTFAIRTKQTDGGPT